MPPSIRSQGTAYSASTAGAVSIDAPDVIAEKDWLLAFVAARQNTALTTPSGWTKEAEGLSTNGGTYNPRTIGAVFSKLATASEGSSYSFTAPAGGFVFSAQIFALKDVNPDDVYDIDVRQGDNITAIPTSLVSTRSGLYLAMIAGDLAASAAVPGTMTSLRNTAAAGNNAEMVVGSHPLANGETYGPTFSGGNLWGACIRLAIADKPKIPAAIG